MSNLKNVLREAELYLKFTGFCAEHPTGLPVECSLAAHQPVVLLIGKRHHGKPELAK